MLEQIIIPKRLVHSGKKRAYPSWFVWDCPDCNKWNIWHTKMLLGKVTVCCQDCREKFTLDKSKRLAEWTRTRNDKRSIID